ARGRKWCCNGAPGVASSIEFDPMRVGVPKETAPGERRVALVPDAISRLGGQGFQVVVERGAGTAAGFPDAAYEEAGAELADSVWGDAEAVAKVQQPS